MALKDTRSEQNYISILADGLLHLPVPEGTEGAVVREYETSDGTKGSKTEMVFTELSGIISKIAFFEGDFGKLLQLTVSDGDEDPITLSVSTASNFGEDLMKKLPALDITLPVRLVPYSFTDDKGKNKKGVTVYQNEVKIGSHYYDEVTKKLTNGLPPVPVPKKGKSISKDEWKVYFMQVRIFLIDKITELFDLEAQDHTAQTKDGWDDDTVKEEEKKAPEAVKPRGMKTEDIGK